MSGRSREPAGAHTEHFALIRLEDIEAQIFASVLNLVLGDCRMVRGASFSGARYLDLDRARLWYQWEFNLDWTISDADGVQPRSEPLRSIEVDLWKQPHEWPPTENDPAVVIKIPTVGVE